MQNYFWNRFVKTCSRGLTDEDYLFIRKKIASENLGRMKVFTVITLVIQMSLILFIDLPSIERARFGGIGLGSGENLEIPILFMIIHTILALNMVLGFLIATYFDKKIKSSLSSLKKFEILFFSIGEFTLILMSAIAVLDQLRSGDISSFTLNCLLVAAFIYLIPPMNYLVFLPPYMVFVTGVFLIQKDLTLRVTYLTNSSVFFVTMIILSTIVFNMHLKQLIGERLLEIANRKLDEMALKDQLTGLSNRYHFINIFNSELLRIQEEKVCTYMAILDIDNFKQINDSYGHPVGDKVLIKISETLKNIIRENDLATRWGGEEFVILLCDIDKEGALEIMENIRQIIEADELNIKGEKIKYTISIGLSRIKNDTEDPLQDAYDWADRAMYKAKLNGKNQIKISGDKLS